MYSPKMMDALFLVAVASAGVAAVPPESMKITTSATLYERQSSNVTCGGMESTKLQVGGDFVTDNQIGVNFYTREFIGQTFDNAADNYERMNKKAMGNNTKYYPEPFNNYENAMLRDCPGVPAPFEEFPILASMVQFATGSDPSTDRFVYKVTGTDSTTGLPDNFAFCGVITHLNAAQGQFVACSPT